MSKDIIATERLLLRPLAKSDAEAIAALADNYKVVVMLARLPYPYRLEHAREYIALIGKRSLDERPFALCRKDGAKELMGVASCERREKGEPPELGYWLGEPYWGKGYMSEAVKAVVRHAFTSGGHQRLVSSCRLQNHASRRVLEKAGFENVGEIEIDSLVLEAKVPGHRFELSRERWKGFAA
jgi:RimJ/RimL family protein N-acetyltransferase